MSHYHILIFGGQSNMGGYGSIAGLPLASYDAPNTVYAQPTLGTFPNALYCESGGDGIFEDAWEAYPLASESTYGPELAALWKYRDNNPTRHIAAIKHAAGGSSIQDWINETWGYATLSAAIGQAVARLTGAGHTYEFDAFKWIQGETGATDVEKQINNPSVGDLFITDTLELFDRVRDDTSEDIKFIVGRIGDHMVSDWYVQHALIDQPGGDQYTAEEYVAAVERRWAQQAEIVAATPNSILVSNHGIPNREEGVNAIHWPDDGYLAAGERLAAGYEALSLASVPKLIIGVA